RESVYDTELYRILLSWLAKYEYVITSQWHILLDADDDDKNDTNVDGKKYFLRPRRERVNYVDTRGDEDNGPSKKSKNRYPDICLTLLNTDWVLIFELLATG